MKRLDYNLRLKAKMPESYEISGDLSGYISSRNKKRQEYRTAAEANVKTPKVRTDQFEVYLKALITYAENMPDAPLQVSEYQYGWIITKTKAYKKWSLSRESWATIHVDNAGPDLKFHNRLLVVEEEEETEQFEFFT